MAVGPGVESVAVEVFIADPNASRWDQAIWDGAHFGDTIWVAVDCQTTEANYQRGVMSEAGVLSTPEAGPLDLATYDPNRLLDPSNTESVYFGQVIPGCPLRVVGGVSPSTTVAWTGFVDEMTFDVASSTGRVRCHDGISYLAQATVPDGAIVANTLRARVREVITKVGMSAFIPVQAEDVPPETDPAVAPHDSKSASAWEIIQRAAADTLVMVWLDATGMLRFTSWGAFPDSPQALGCPGAGDDPANWIRGLQTVGFGQNAHGIRNSVLAESSVGVLAPAISDSASINRYGARAYEVRRVVPDRTTWAARILEDRADAGLTVTTGEVRPYDLTDLATLLGLGTLGPQVIRIRDDEHGPLIDRSVSVVGSACRVTAMGWVFGLITAIPRAEWEATEPPPPEPPTPPPDPFHTETRDYACTADALLALTSSSAKYGAGAANSLPVGAWSGWTYRSCLKFATIPWTQIKAVTSAVLHIKTSTQVRVGFGSSPTIEVRRITQNWNAGSASSPSSGNAVVYPGPSTTSTGAVRPNITEAENTFDTVTVTDIVRAWAPTSVPGGAGLGQYGLMLLPGSGSQADTTEFRPEEDGSTHRAFLRLVVEVWD